MINPHSPSFALLLAFAALLPTPALPQPVQDLPARDQALTIEQEHLYSVGSMSGEDWESFARIAGVAFDQEENLYILDSQNSRVIKVAPGGRFVAQLGRAGGGPGEFTRPLGFCVTREGEVRVFDMGNQGFTLFNPDATFKSTARVGNGDFFLPTGALLCLPDGRMTDGGMATARMQVVVAGDNSARTAPRPVHLFTLEDGVQVGSAYDAWNPLTAAGSQREQTVSGGGIQFSAAPMRAFDAGLFVGALPDGHLAVADSTTYTVKVVDPERGVVRTLRRPFTPRKVTRADQNAEREHQLERIAAMEGTQGGTAGRAYTSDGSGGGTVRISGGQAAAMLRTRVEGMEFGEEIPVVAGMVVDWDGRIWVERTGRRVGEGGPIDLIDAQGRYAGSLDPDEFEIPDAFGPGGLVAYVETDELDVPRVVVKRLRVG